MSAFGANRSHSPIFLTYTPKYKHLGDPILSGAFCCHTSCFQKALFIPYISPAKKPFYFTLLKLSITLLMNNFTFYWRWGRERERNLGREPKGSPCDRREPQSFCSLKGSSKDSLLHVSICFNQGIVKQSTGRFGCLKVFQILGQNQRIKLPDVDRYRSLLQRTSCWNHLFLFKDIRDSFWELFLDGSLFPPLPGLYSLNSDCRFHLKPKKSMLVLVLFNEENSERFPNLATCLPMKKSEDWGICVVGKWRIHVCKIHEDSCNYQFLDSIHFHRFAYI